MKYHKATRPSIGIYSINFMEKYLNIDVFIQHDGKVSKIKNKNTYWRYQNTE